MKGNLTYVLYGTSSDATHTFNTTRNSIGIEKMGMSFLEKQKNNLILKTR